MAYHLGSGRNNSDLPSYYHYTVLDQSFTGINVTNPKISPPTNTPDPFAILQDGSDLTWSSETITETEGIRALRTHCRKKFCWGEGPIARMQTTSVQSSMAFKYIINTWTEKRCVALTFKPFGGGVVDGDWNGSPPTPWSIGVVHPVPFTQKIVRITVPHTENIRPCITCTGRGRNQCYKCDGKVTIKCNCKVSSDCSDKKCDRCNGKGRYRCTNCNKTPDRHGGSGWTQCDVCDGYGQLKYYIELTVTFHTHSDSYIHQTTDLPDDNILMSNGHKLVDQTDDRIGAITNFDVDDINTSSAALVMQHSTKWPDERIWKQNQKLEVIPVHEVKYVLDNSTEGRFWVYGDKKWIYSDDYPAQCCRCLNVPFLFNNCAFCNDCTML